MTNTANNEIIWENFEEFGYNPCCPHCGALLDDPEYYGADGTCWRCHEPYVWKDFWRKDKAIQVGKYLITQSGTSCHVMITSDDGFYYHASCTEPMTEDELKSHFYMI